MLKKIISILTVIILLVSLAFPAFADDSSVEDVAVEETSAEAAAGIIIGFDDYYDGYYEDYRGTYGFSDDNKDDGLDYASTAEKRNLQDAYIKLVEYCKTWEFEAYPSYSGYVENSRKYCRTKTIK